MGCSSTTVGATPNSASTEDKSPPAKKIEYSHSVSAPTQTFTVIAPSQQTVTAEKQEQPVTVEKFHTEVEVTVRILHYSPLKLEQALQWGQALSFSKLLKPDATVTRVKLQYVHNDHWQPQALKTEEVVVPAELMKRPGQYVLQVSIEDPSAPNSAGFWLYFNVESPKP